MRILVLLLLLGLTGCASQSRSDAYVHYIRADGQPVDTGHVRMILAQCQGEGARGAPATNVGYAFSGWISRPHTQGTLINACMARNGYLEQS
jgi:hypothetical protein